MSLDGGLADPKPSADKTFRHAVIADVAQLAEQPPRKWQVVGSNPTVGSMDNREKWHLMSPPT